MLPLSFHGVDALSLLCNPRRLGSAYLMVTFHWGVLGIEQNTYRILEVIHQADEVKFLQPPTHKSFTFYVFFFFFFEDFK